MVKCGYYFALYCSNDGYLYKFQKIVNMKKTVLSLFLFSLVIAGFSQTAFTAGNLAVVRVVGPLINTGNAVIIDEFLPAGGAAVQSIALPSTGTNKLVSAGSSPSEALLTRSVDGTAIMVAGYDAAIPYASSLSATASATVSRTIGVIKYDGSVDVTTKLSDFSTGSNPRSVASTDGTTFWACGGAGGIRYAALGTTSSTQVNTTTPVNLRQIAIFNGNLYFTTASITTGLDSLSGGGLPTTAGQTPVNIFPTLAGSSPYGFALNSTGDVAYIADDRNTGPGGIQRWTRSGTVWSLAYTLGTGVANIGARGLAVDFTIPTAPVIYATSSEATANRLIKITDDLSGTSAATTLATAPAGSAFRGMSFAPKAGVLGVRFVSFTGNSTNSGFNLKWVTANEQSVSAFTVQKSKDGLTFEDINSTAAHNDNNGAEYHFNYNGTDKGFVYFRIKATELSGRTFYTGIIRSDIKDAHSFNLYPTVSTGNITLDYGAAGTSGAISILNNSGSEVFRKNVAAGTSGETISVQQLAPGTYFVKYAAANCTVQTLRFVKQ